MNVITIHTMHGMNSYHKFNYQVQFRQVRTPLSTLRVWILIETVS